MQKSGPPLHRFSMRGYTFAALGLIGVGIGIRVALLAQGWPHTNSDEGTYGMMAINIAFHGDHPIFMYGQNYMGTIQAYLAALMFRLFGICSPACFTAEASPCLRCSCWAWDQAI
jgi:hypothetical protein